MATIFILSVAAFLKLKNSDVFIYAFILLFICVLGYVFSIVMRPKDTIGKVALYILVMSIVITTSVITLSFGSYILFQKPAIYGRWFDEKIETIIDSSSQSRDSSLNNVSITEKNMVNSHKKTKERKVLTNETNERSVSIQLSEKSNGYYTIFLDGKRIYPTAESTKFNPRLEIKNYQGQGIILIVTNSGDSCWTALPNKMDSTLYRLIPNCL
jgi:hypothetical protein